jgi:hypothetical protein
MTRFPVVPEDPDAERDDDDPEREDEPEEPDALRELPERDEPEALRELPAPLLFDLLLESDDDLLELPRPLLPPVPLLLCFGMLFPSGEKTMRLRARCVPRR